MSVEVTRDEVIFCKQVEGVEVKLSAWGTVAVRDVKFLILKKSFYGDVFKISVC